MLLQWLSLLQKRISALLLEYNLYDEIEKVGHRLPDDSVCMSHSCKSRFHLAVLHLAPRFTWSNIWNLNEFDIYQRHREARSKGSFLSVCSIKITALLLKWFYRSIPQEVQRITYRFQQFSTKTNLQTKKPGLILVFGTSRPLPKKMTEIVGSCDWQYFFWICWLRIWKLI
jgi:hypothetical protein